MSIGEHAETFAGLPIRDYAPGDAIDDPMGVAYRFAIDYDQSEEGQTIAAILARFLEDPASRQVKAIVIGPWDGLYDGGDGIEGVVNPLAAAAAKLPGLRALFIGDVTSEECELSWINQTDVTPVLEAFPALEEFRVRGGNGLLIRPIQHAALRALALEAGGLPAEAVQGITGSDLPNLEDLELWIGTDDYGRTTTVEDLAPILSGDRLPKLRRLALRNAEIADEIATALADAPVLRRIESLDLSLGTLGDEGALALLKGGHLTGLKSLSVRRHFITPEVLDGLKATGVDLDDSEAQEEESYGRYVEHGE